MVNAQPRMDQSRQEEDFMTSYAWRLPRVVNFPTWSTFWPGPAHQGVEPRCLLLHTKKGVGPGPAKAYNLRQADSDCLGSV